MQRIIVDDTCFGELTAVRRNLNPISYPCLGKP